MKPTVLLIAGNPVDGFTYTGPFEDHETAQVHAENEKLPEWWLATMETPPEAIAY